MKNITLIAITVVLFNLPTYSQRNARSLSDHIKAKKERVKIDKGTTTITINTPYTDAENYQQFSDMLFDKGYFFEKEDEKRGYIETERAKIGNSVDVQYYLRVKMADQKVVITPYVYRTRTGGVGLLMQDMILNEPMAYKKLVGSRIVWPQIIDDVKDYCDCTLSYSN